MKIEITLREDFTLNDWLHAKKVADAELFRLLSNTPNGEVIGKRTLNRNGYEEDFNWIPSKQDSDDGVGVFTGFRGRTYNVTITCDSLKGE